MTNDSYELPWQQAGNKPEQGACERDKTMPATVIRTLHLLAYSHTHCGHALTNTDALVHTCRAHMIAGGQSMRASCACATVTYWQCIGTRFQQ